MSKKSGTNKRVRTVGLWVSALAYCLAVGFAIVGVRGMIRQRADDQYVRSVTFDVLNDSPKTDLVSKITALRDYLRTHVRNIDFSARTRPFLRNTAADTLRMGKGRCGEATRTFINMARAAGIPAQRLYLEGRKGEKAHVVAIVDGEDGSRLIVDAADRPLFADIEPLSNLPRHEEFTYYSTFEWRRSRLLRKLAPNELSLGPLIYLLENPHALVACLCFVASGSSLVLAVALRRRLRRAIAQHSAAEFTLPAALEGASVEI